MTSALKLSVYFGESDRVDGRLLSDVLVDDFQSARVRAAVLLRATEGFGIKHRLHTQRLLTLSEDLPLVAVAVDEPARIEPLLPRLQGLVDDGLVTLERTRLVEDVRDPGADDAPLGEGKLTIFVGRSERAGGRPAYLTAVDLLRSHGFDGALVLLGLDGLAHGRRRRARFFSRNAGVPLMIVAYAATDAIRATLAPLAQMLADPLITLERVTVCKRDGVLLTDPPHVAGVDASGLAVWQKLTVHAAEDARHDGHALYLQLIRRLRLEGAGGATALRGIWGFAGTRPPHGDRLLSLGRGVPVMTVLVDRPDEIRRLWPVVDEVTVDAGLVTSEVVPASHALGPGIASGGLRLAHP